MRFIKKEESFSGTKCSTYTFECQPGIRFRGFRMATKERFLTLEEKSVKNNPNI